MWWWWWWIHTIQMISFMSSSSIFSDEQILEFHEAFCLFDKDGDGCLTIKELGFAIKSLGVHPTKDEVQHMMNQVDVNRNGTMQFGELLDLMAKQIEQVEAGEQLREAFSVFDKDQDGYISPKELRRVMINLVGKLKDEEVEQMIKHADLDGDGRLNYNDFVRIILN